MDIRVGVQGRKTAGGVRANPGGGQMCWAGKLCTSGGKGGKGGTKEARTGHERAKGLQEGTRMSLRFTTYHGNGCVKCCREMGNPSFSVTSFFVMGQLVTGVSLVPDVLGHAHGRVSIIFGSSRGECLQRCPPTVFCFPWFSNISLFGRALHTPLWDLEPRLQWDNSPILAATILFFRR